jgi:hypothetical protein
MDGKANGVIVLVPDNGRDDLQLTVDADGVQCGIVRIVPSMDLTDGRSIPDYTGVLQVDELPVGTGHGPYFYHGQLYDQ